MKVPGEYLVILGDEFSKLKIPKTPGEFWECLNEEFLHKKVDLNKLKHWVRHRLELFLQVGSIDKIPDLDVHQNQSDACEVFILADGKDLEIWLVENFKAI